MPSPKPLCTVNGQVISVSDAKAVKRSARSDFSETYEYTQDIGETDCSLEQVSEVRAWKNGSAEDSIKQVLFDAVYCRKLSEVMSTAESAAVQKCVDLLSEAQRAFDSRQAELKIRLRALSTRDVVSFPVRLKSEPPSPVIRAPSNSPQSPKN